MMMCDAQGALLRAVRRMVCQDPMLTAFGTDRQLPILTIEGLESESWMSMTFSGHRHRLDLRIEGTSDELAAVRDRLAARLREADLDITGHALIDLALMKAETRAADHTGLEICRMTFEALTVED